MAMRNFFNAAIEEAQKSSYKQPMGCVVVYRNRIVGRGYNKVYGRRHVKYDSCHAEIAAINNTTAKYREGTKAFVCRRSAIGLGLAKPCQACTVVLKKVGVKEVWYSTKNGWEKMKLRS